MNISSNVYIACRIYNSSCIQTSKRFGGDISKTWVLSRKITNNPLTAQQTSLVNHFIYRKQQNQMNCQRNNTFMENSLRKRQTPGRCRGGAAGIAVANHGGGNFSFIYLLILKLHKFTWNKRKMGLNAIYAKKKIYIGRYSYNVREYESFCIISNK